MEELSLQKYVGNAMLGATPIEQHYHSIGCQKHIYSFWMIHLQTVCISCKYDKFIMDESLSH